MQLKYWKAINAKNILANNFKIAKFFSCSFQNWSACPEFIIFFYDHWPLNFYQGMLIKGGVTMITRGFGQTVTLEPYLFAEDPDYPEMQYEGMEFRQGWILWEHELWLY